MTPHGCVRLSVIPQVMTLPSRTVRLSCGISQCRLDTHTPFSFPPKDSSVKQGAVRPLCPLGPRDARLPSARPGGQAGKAGDSRLPSAPRFSRGAGEAGEGRPCSTQGKSPAARDLDERDTAWGDQQSGRRVCFGGKRDKTRLFTVLAGT